MSSYIVEYPEDEDIQYDGEFEVVIVGNKATVGRVWNAAGEEVEFELLDEATRAQIEAFIANEAWELNE